jgi:hypothetical protein
MVSNTDGVYLACTWIETMETNQGWVVAFLSGTHTHTHIYIIYNMYVYMCICMYIYIYWTALLRYSCCIECQDPFRGHAKSHKGHLSRGPGKAWVLYQHFRNLLWLLIPCGSMWSFQVVLSCFMCSLSPSCNFAQLQCFEVGWEDRQTRLHPALGLRLNSGAIAPRCTRSNMQPCQAISSVLDYWICFLGSSTSLVGKMVAMQMRRRGSSVKICEVIFSIRGCQAPF